MNNITDLLLHIHVIFNEGLVSKRELRKLGLDSKGPLFMLEAGVEFLLVHPGLLVDSFRDVLVGFQAAFLFE